MNHAALRHKDLTDVDFQELDDLIAKLTPEEIDLLNDEVDPDDPYLPPSDRCKEQTKKKPTGPFDRNKLLRFLEEQGKNEKDWEKNKSYVKETKGKVWQPPPKPVTRAGAAPASSTERSTGGASVSATEIAA